MTDLYPLRLKERYRNYTFGGRWIVDAYEKDDLPENHTVAETWEACDRDPDISVVLNGDLAGKTIHELIDAYGADFLGTGVVATCGMRFPLLLKFLDATHVLGEQAHHNDELAAKEGLDDPGKTEAWYMLNVRPDASIHCGAKAGVTWDQIHDALADGTIKDLMEEYSVEVGDAFLLYAGTMHYAKGGVIFYEIMQNSDVYIGLTPELDGMTEAEKEAKLQSLMEGIHLEEGFVPKITSVKVTQNGNTHTHIFACRYFSLERFDLTKTFTYTSDGSRFCVLSQIQGNATIVYGAHRIPMKPGYSCLLPANLGDVTIEPGKNCAFLKSYVPDIKADIIDPLRAAGVPDAAIAGLGGKTRLNDIIPLLD